MYTDTEFWRTMKIYDNLVEKSIKEADGELSVNIAIFLINLEESKKFIASYYKKYDKLMKEFVGNDWYWDFARYIIRKGEQAYKDALKVKAVDNELVGWSPLLSGMKENMNSQGSVIDWYHEKKGDYPDPDYWDLFQIYSGKRTLKIYYVRKK